MPSPQKVASTPARPADSKRNDTPAPRRSRRLSTQSSDGESSDQEGRKPVRRKLLKNLESVKEEAETDEVPKVAAETPTRRSRRLSNQSAEGDNEDNTAKALAIPLTLEEEDEEKVEDDENVDKVCSESGSPIISTVKRPVSINIESDSEDEKTPEKMEAESEQEKETEKSAEMVEEIEQEKNTDATIENEEPKKTVLLHLALFMTEIYKNSGIGRAVRK
jgi:hypothetical protein